MRIFFYGLTDPIHPGLFRYVGRTFNLIERKAQHRAANNSSQTIIQQWERMLMACGRYPQLHVLDFVDADNGRGSAVERFERQLILDVWNEGHSLVNSRYLTDVAPLPARRDYAAKLSRLIDSPSEQSLSLVTDCEATFPLVFNLCRIANPIEELIRNAKEKPRCRSARQAAVREAIARAT